VIFNGGVEYIVVGKENVKISFGENALIFHNVYYVSGMDLNLFLVSQIMRHCLHLDVNFSNHKCYTID
jgi:hypothetical protein